MAPSSGAQLPIVADQMFRTAVAEPRRGSRCCHKEIEKEVNMRLIKYPTAATLAGALVVAAAASSAYGQYYYGPGYYPGNAYAYDQATLT